MALITTSPNKGSSFLIVYKNVKMISKLFNHFSAFRSKRIEVKVLFFLFFFTIYTIYVTERVWETSPPPTYTHTRVYFFLL